MNVLSFLRRQGSIVVELLITLLTLLFLNSFLMLPAAPVIKGLLNWGD